MSGPFLSRFKGDNQTEQYANFGVALGASRMNMGKNPEMVTKFMAPPPDAAAAPGPAALGSPSSSWVPLERRRASLAATTLAPSATVAKKQLLGQ